MEEKNLYEEKMKKAIGQFGLKDIVHPVFYSCDFGIRFKIGVGEIYDNLKNVNSEYVATALNRAVELFNVALPTPSLLMWEIYPQTAEDEDWLMNELENRISLGVPHQRTIENDNEVTIRRIRLYWDLEKIDLEYQRLFKEIILGDLGGFPHLVSSVFLFDLNCCVMFHLYDDRGLDIVSKDKETLIALYRKFNSWILDYDRKIIDARFEEL